jgi:hypothetical protein
MQYGCGLCNNNHRIILCMIFTFEQKIFEKLPFEQSHIRAIDFRAADFEQFVFEQLHSSNLPRFHERYVTPSTRSGRFSVNMWAWISQRGADVALMVS